MNDLKQIIALNIAKLRKRDHLTQADLADILNYSDKAVSKWERGESTPDIVILKQIADQFGVTVDYLISEEHSASDAPPKSNLSHKNLNIYLIPSLSVAGLWFIAVTLSIILTALIPDFGRTWLIYISALPLTATILLVFSCIWGRKIHIICSVTFLVWSAILTLYLFLIDYNLWLLFLIGVPAQIIILLWSRLVFPSKKNKN